MTTAWRTETDLAVYCAVLEQCDAETLTASYTEDAEITIVRCSDPTREPQVYRGREAIGRWIAGWCLDLSQLRVVNQVKRGVEMTVIAELRDAEGDIAVFACTARLLDGLVHSQFVVLV